MKFRALEFNYQADAEAQWWERARILPRPFIPVQLLSGSDSDSDDQEEAVGILSHSSPHSSIEWETSHEPDWCKRRSRETIASAAAVEVETVDEKDDNSIDNIDPKMEQRTSVLLLANLPWSEDLRSQSRKTNLTYSFTPTYPPFVMKYAILHLQRPVRGFFGPPIAFTETTKTYRALVYEHSQSALPCAIDLHGVFDLAMAAMRMISSAQVAPAVKTLFAAKNALGEPARGPQVKPSRKPPSVENKMWSRGRTYPPSKNTLSNLSIPHGVTGERERFQQALPSQTRDAAGIFQEHTPSGPAVAMDDQSPSDKKRHRRKKARKEAKREVKRLRKLARRSQKTSDQQEQVRPNVGVLPKSSHSPQWKFGQQQAEFEDWTSVDDQLGAARRALKRRAPIATYEQTDAKPLAKRLRTKTKPESTSRGPCKALPVKLRPPFPDQCDGETGAKCSSPLREPGLVVPTDVCDIVSSTLEEKGLICDHRKSRTPSRSIFPARRKLQTHSSSNPQKDTWASKDSESPQQTSRALLLHKQGYNRAKVHRDFDQGSIDEAARGDHDKPLPSGQSCLQRSDVSRKSIRCIRDASEEKKTGERRIVEMFLPGNEKGASSLQPEHLSQQSEKSCNQFGDEAPPSTTATDYSRRPPVVMLCSESFLENWGEVVGSLGSGQWAQSCSPPNQEHLLPELRQLARGQSIACLDTQLVDVRAVHLELPYRSAALVYSASELLDTRTARSIALKIAEITAIDRYRVLFIFLSYDVDLTPELLESIARIQSPFLRPSKDATAVYFKTTTPGSLAECIAETAVESFQEDESLESSVLDSIRDPNLQGQLFFLLTILPTLSARGACQLLQLQPFLAILQNPRVRQSIMLQASAAPSRAPEVHPRCMLQLSQALRAFTGLL